MTEASARIIADSISPAGHRLTTFEATCWRPVLAEQNTHRVFERNSASSRAIPVSKTLKRYDEDFAWPLTFPAEKPGMQGGTELLDQPRRDATDLWMDLSDTIYRKIKDYVEAHPDPATRLHKSMLNRWLEVGLWQTQIITATSLDGYFWQRVHKDAEPHIRAMATAMKKAFDASEPYLVPEGRWHLPLWGFQGGAGDRDYEDAESLVRNGLPSMVMLSEDTDKVERLVEFMDNKPSTLDISKACSAARCARVSYLTHDGSRDLIEDIDLYLRLTTNRIGDEDPPHASPLGHVATPWADNAQTVTLLNGKEFGPVPKVGPLLGWAQLRHLELGF